jgi:hypothetical protein
MVLVVPKWQCMCSRSRLNKLVVTAAITAAIRSSSRSDTSNINSNSNGSNNSTGSTANGSRALAVLLKL